MHDRSFASPEEILDSVALVCAAFPGSKRVRLFCRAERLRAIACIIDARPDVVPDLARALGTIPFGHTVVPQVAIANGFDCPGRVAGQMVRGACDDCERVLPPPAQLR